MRALADIQTEMREAAARMDNALFVEYWGEDIPPEKRILEYYHLYRQSVLNKKKIQCACLGAVFNLPMSTVTIIEDALMIAMSGIMLITML